MAIPISRCRSVILRSFMFTIRRRVATLLGGILLAGLAVVATESPASAASGITRSVPFSFDQVGHGFSDLAVTLVAGDCRLKGMNQDETAVIFFDNTRTGSPDIYEVTWVATTYTISTFFGDVWHATFTFYNNVGVQLFQLRFDSPTMRKDITYRFSRTTTVTVSSAVVHSISTVDWRGDC
jgi:hypothetical protein